ncbi:peritrophin-48-like [Panulirus ornatus]|uniref:peritrophin-48-like n=1 Tax=Panulirus ornatus TaxID=150431 RepID=UPI003A885F16
MPRLLHLLFLLAVVSTPVLCFSCEPDCSSYQPGAFVEDPLNCTQFYLCLQDGMPSDHTIPCQSGHVFDPESMSCVTGADCIPSCYPVYCHITCNGTYDIISNPLNCNQYYFCVPGQIEGPLNCPPDRPFFDGESCIADDSHCCQNLCLPFCFYKNYEIPDPLDCNKYYICLEEGMADEALHFSCPPGENFDLPAGRCVPGAKCNVLCPE